jgi:imidazolonepropionase-like amidohydrolase
VVVCGDRITEVAPAAEVRLPEGVIRIEAGGKYLIPGLAELHGHIPPPTAPANLVESVLFLYVANGVTTVRGMLGAPGQLQLRDRVLSGEILGPTLYLAGPSFSGRSVHSASQAEERVRQQKQEGWDLLKIHPGLTRDQYDAIARTAREVGMRFAGHVPEEVGLLHAFAMGQETIDHLDGYMEYLGGDTGPIAESELLQVARATIEAGVWVVPTMALWETILGASELEVLRRYPELRYMPEDQVERWEDAFRGRLRSPQFDRGAVARIAANRRQLLRVLDEQNVPILLGTDAPQQFSVPGFSIHREVQLMSDVGMSPYAILKSGTASVGDYFEDKDRFGTIAVGQRADLVLLAANPLDDVSHLRHIAGVLVRGEWLPEDAIQQRLKAIAR